MDAAFPHFREENGRDQTFLDLETVRGLGVNQ